jgi:sigma-54 dependent transcriptional regulator, flagellar regulatory protein
LPSILLIDENKTRAQHLETVLRFMEYQVQIADSTNFSDFTGESDDLFGIFIGDGLVKQAEIITALSHGEVKTPLILVIDKPAKLQDSTVLNQDVFQVLEWPVTFPSLKRITDKITSPSGGQEAEQEDPSFYRRGFQDRRSGYDRRISARDRLKGDSQAVTGIRKAITQVGKTDATVLILGESGTGKEIIARSIHEASLRRGKLFVPINCGAIPADLLESELFGHEKGAFTGALGARQGRFEMAEGGTLFLDEIGDMPMPMQVKLLRVLQERTFERVGSNKTIHCDVRVIAATHRHLADEIKENRFREDLFYRLNVFPIEVSPLRERIEDVPVLVEDIIECMKVTGRGEVQFAQSAIVAFMHYDWPGNIRELANLIERMAIIYPDELVDATKLPEKFQKFRPSAVSTGSHAVEHAYQAVPQEITALPQSDDSKPQDLAHLPSEGIDLKEYLTILEEDLIRQALNESNGIVAHAAKRLNMRRTTLVEKLRKFDLER